VELGLPHQTKRPHQSSQLPPTPQYYHHARMVRKRSIKAQEREIRLIEAVIGVKSGKYKTAYAASKALQLNLNTILKRVNGGNTQQEARQQQQLLSKNQETVLLKWIKELTTSGYAPSYRILREVAEEVRSNKCRVFQTQVS
jgi:hypothetical protein